MCKQPQASCSKDGGLIRHLSSNSEPALYPSTVFRQPLPLPQGALSCRSPTTDIRYHLYEDDTQLYGSFYPNELPDLINRFEHCIAEVKTWMKVNKLKLNDKKTEVILLGSNNITKHVPSPSLHIDDISREATDKVKNLGVTIDKNLSLSFFIGTLCKNSYVQLRKIASIRYCLTT